MSGAGVARAVLRCARGRPDGLALFEATPRAFAASLAPLVAFPLVGAALGALQEGPLSAASNLAATVCVVLAPPVISHAFARACGREDAWLRYAVAFNWCQWALPVLVVAAAIAAAVLGFALEGLHLGGGQIAAGLAAALIGYWLWLHWFLVRSGLGVSRGRAALLVLAVDLCTWALMMLPRMVG